MTREAPTTETLRAEIHTAVETAKGMAMTETPPQWVALPDPAVSLTVEISPLRIPRYPLCPPGSRVCAAAFVRQIRPPAGPPPAVLRALFGLTSAEARLAAKLAQGPSLDEIATEFGIHIETARNQLKSIFLKTDIHRQSELVRLVLSAGTSLRGTSPTTRA